MLQKLKNKKGFTLMEMLIVVAIIAVLVAIAIPTFSGALKKSKQAADVANIRAYYAKLQIEAIEKGDTAVSDATDGDAFKTEMKNAGYNLNYDVTYDPDKGVITYVADKLDGGNGKDAHTYTWTLGDATA